ncbi:VanW family protein [Solibacillus merdavium]|uniref:VanW family protein n=1 Tax=Solibacillus merdavium TaxID=2762218 RepID=A0ABR8XRI1_9BACL|nr:VanW family protein [Solibacillus merdavium]MBD8034549.1 VanW family protein [Solibacillus merdavium]
MKIVFRSIALLVLIVALLAIWVPHFIASSNATPTGNSGGSTIGGMEVGDLKGDELKAGLQNAVNDWYTKNLIVTGGGTSIEVSSPTLQFDIEATVNSFEDNYRKPWYAFWADEAAVHLPLNILPSDIVKNEISNISAWDADLTYEKVQLNASYLKTDEVKAVVNDFSILEIDRISLLVETIPEGAMGMNELVLELQDIVIEPQMPFSMLENLGETINLANREAINFIASNIYNAALNINAEILERHSQNERPSYLKPGLEAKVDVLTNEDLKFINTSTNPVVLKLSMNDGKLQTEVYTPAKEIEISVSVSNDEEIQPRTITRYSEDLAIGQTEQLQDGVEGLRISVYRTVYGEQQLVSRDYYPPVNRVIVKSSQQPVIQDSVVDVNNATDDSIDLDGDGFPDEDGSGGNPPINNQQNTNSNELSSESRIEEGSKDNLPPGSYYDKGGNLITP